MCGNRAELPTEPCRRSLGYMTGSHKNVQASRVREDSELRVPVQIARVLQAALSGGHGLQRGEQMSLSRVPRGWRVQSPWSSGGVVLRRAQRGEMRAGRGTGNRYDCAEKKPKKVMCSSCGRSKHGFDALACFCWSYVCRLQVLTYVNRERGSGIADACFVKVRGCELLVGREVGLALCGPPR